MATVPNSNVYLGDAGFKKIGLTGKWPTPFKTVVTYDQETSTRGLSPEELENRTTEQVLDGSYSLEYTWEAGVTGDGNTDPGSGIFDYSRRIYRGETLYFMIHAYYENGYTWLAEDPTFGKIKFMRVSTHYADGSNGGFLDVYVDEEDQRVDFTYEGDNRWSYKIPTGVGFPQNEEWQSYQIAITLDHVSKDDGGLAEITIWRNGVRLMNETGRTTLVNDVGAYAQYPHYNTYWNYGTTQEQTAYLDHIVWSNIIPSTVDAGGFPRLESLTDA